MQEKHATVQEGIFDQLTFLVFDEIYNYGCLMMEQW